jgi:hypothetical protein
MQFKDQAVARAHHLPIDGRTGRELLNQASRERTIRFCVTTTLPMVGSYPMRASSLTVDAAKGCLTPSANRLSHLRLLFEFASPFC